MTKKELTRDFYLSINQFPKGKISLKAESPIGWTEEIVALKQLFPVIEAMQAINEDGEAEDYENLGKALYNTFFPGEIHELFERNLHHFFSHAVGLRLIIEDKSDNRYHYPWEYLHDGDEFLLHSFRISLIRKIPVKYHVKPQKIPKNELIRILAVLSSPLDLDIQKKELRVHREIIIFNDATLPLVREGRIETLLLDRTSMMTIQQAMRAFKPHILYFTGHGGIDNDGIGIFVLEDDYGMQSNVKAPKVAKLLRGHPQLQLVIFNICQSLEEETGKRINSIAQAVSAVGINALVGMQGIISYESSFIFTQTLLDAFSAGLSLERAVIEARRAMLLSGPMPEKEWGAPVLLMTDIPDHELQIGLNNVRTGLKPAPMKVSGIKAKSNPRIRCRGYLQWASSSAERALSPIFPSITEDKFPNIKGKYNRSEILVNRRRELRALEVGIFEKKQNLALITGGEGIGKTALINAFIHRNSERFEGVLLLSFKDKKSAKQILLDTLQLYDERIYDNCTSENTEQILRKVIKILEDHFLLLVFDNLELVSSNEKDRKDKMLRISLSELVQSNRRSVMLFSSCIIPEWLNIPDKAVKVPLQELAPQQVRHFMLDQPNLSNLSLKEMISIFRKFGGNPSVLIQVDKILSTGTFEDLMQIDVS